MTRYAAVIFDLDGTLLDTLTDIGTAANRVLESHQLPTHDIAAYRQFVGNGVEVLMDRATPRRLPTGVTLAALSAQFRQIYSESWNLSTKPYPEVPELIAHLQRRGVPLAVLSNKPHRNTLACTEAFFPPQTFVSVLGQRENIPCKPDPAAALEIAGAFGLKPSECLFLGDSDVDMQTAAAAGMAGIGAAWGFRSAAELIANGACCTIDHPLQLLEEFGDAE